MSVSEASVSRQRPSSSKLQVMTMTDAKPKQHESRILAELKVMRHACELLHKLLKATPCLKSSGRVLYFQSCSLRSLDSFVLHGQNSAKNIVPSLTCDAIPEPGVLVVVRKVVFLELPQV